MGVQTLRYGDTKDIHTEYIAMQIARGLMPYYLHIKTIVNPYVLYNLASFYMFNQLICFYDARCSISLLLFYEIGLTKFCITLIATVIKTQYL